ncbi:class I SAM-dependent methyltransferase [bacterium]|nr:class I SAM-dependent methyltransferase [bacterium]
MISSNSDLLNVSPYEALASIYDSVMSHVDYSSWAQFAFDILSDNGMPAISEDNPPYILEYACGTGIVATILSMNGCRVDAWDKSPEMITIARSRSVVLENAPQFSVKEFLQLDAIERYDAVLCLYDSVNYLMELEDVIDFFIKVKTALKPSGLFLFDICTEFNSKRYFSSSESNEVFEDFSYNRNSRYYDDLMIQENVFTIMFEEQPDKIFVETHKQRIYTVKTIRRIINKTGFDLLEESDNISRIVPTKSSLRVHFLCRKK